MQPSSSMKLSSSMGSASSSAEDVSPQEFMKSQSKLSEQIPRMSKGTQKMTAVGTVGAICMVTVLALFGSAFVAGPDAETSIEGCGDSVTSETTMTLVCFAMGWICCFLMKRQDDVARQVYKMVAQVCKMACSAKELLHSVRASASSVVSAVAIRYRAARTAEQGSWFNKENAKFAGMILAGTLFTGGILGLFISAFAAVPDAEPSNDGLGLASESSQSMRIFTVGWMFLLSFKLRGELVGLCGSSCLLQPW